MELVVRSATLEGVMQSQSAFCNVARRVATLSKGRDDLDQWGVEELFFKTGLFNMLGFSEPGVTLNRCQDAEHAHLCVRSFTGRPMAIVEFERPGEDLGWHTDRLARDARDLLGAAPGLAILTDGRELWVFRVRHGRMDDEPAVFKLAEMSEQSTRALLNYFQHCQVRWPRQLRAPCLW